MRTALGPATPVSQRRRYAAAHFERRELLLSHLLHFQADVGNHEVAHFGSAVPHANLDIVAELGAELAQHAAQSALTARERYAFDLYPDRQGVQT